VAALKGLGAVLFQDLRVDSDGKERKDFPLNQPLWQDASILLAGRNFGGGSSREGAVYALYDHGFRCVLAPSFGDIFAQNAVKNGLLTAIVSEADVVDMAATVSENPQLPVTVDLERKVVVCVSRTYAFDIDPVSRNQLLNGWDDVDLTESYKDRIAQFSADYRARRSWVIPAKS
jgi:3-isopropylmalate/(R)-2-methylmalate dehydratase small subunit